MPLVELSELGKGCFCGFQIILHGAAKREIILLLGIGIRKHFGLRRRRRNGGRACRLGGVVAVAGHSLG